MKISIINIDPYYQNEITTYAEKTKRFDAILLYHGQKFPFDKILNIEKSDKLPEYNEITN